MKLKDIDCRKAKIPLGKNQTKLFDGEGLYLLVRPSSKKWKRKFRFRGKEKTLNIGSYPKMSLKEARKAKNQSKVMVDQGIDPCVGSAINNDLSFLQVAKEWMDKKRNVLAEKTAERHWRILEIHILPSLSDRAIEGIQPRELLDVLERIEMQGKIVTAHKAKELGSNVFQYAVIAHGISSNPAVMLNGVLTPANPVNMAALTDPVEIAQLLKGIDSYHGSIVTKTGLMITAYTFGRQCEVRKMEWGELQLNSKNPLWTIPKEKMKMRRHHIVPLSRQAVDLLNMMHRLQLSPKYVFPCSRSTMRSMSENTITAAIRYIGFSKEQMCAHGFRTMASTRLHEMGYNSDVIERQLAHVSQNKVKAAYNHAQHLPERIKMMQEWADYLDQLKDM